MSAWLVSETDGRLQGSPATGPQGPVGKTHAGELTAMIGRIAYPTDLSKEGQPAFLHALRLALAAQCTLDVLHAASPGTKEDWGAFPHVREVLARWGIMDAAASPVDIPELAGIEVHKAVIFHPEGPAAGVFSYIARHPTGLIVTAPHEHGTLSRLTTGSVSQDIALKTHRPTLFLSERMRPFVDAATGAMHLHTVLVPVDHTPTPARLAEHLGYVFAAFGLAPRLVFVHVGQDLPEVRDSSGETLEVTQLDGPVIPAILEHADKIEADLLVMPTAGHDGFMDMLRGSTTERAMRETQIPLLAVPTS